MASSSSLDEANETFNCSAYNFSALFYLDRGVASVHGYLSSIICIIGIALNIIVCAVLNRTTMRNPFNVILTGISVCDTIKMTTYTYYAIYMYILSDPTPDARHSKLGIQLILAHNVITIIGHVIATQFTVALAFFRFIAVYFPTDGPTWCSMKRTKYCLIGIVVVSVLATLPNSMIYELNYRGDNGTDSWWFDVHDWVKNLKVEKLNMYIYGVFVKMTSSVLICIFSGMLLYALRQVHIRRKRLKADRVRCKEARSLREHTRRTVLLVAVVFSFTVTEFPQGCLNLAAAVDDCVFKVIYFQLGNLMDLLVILNSATNFFWLYSMSSQFREAFNEVFTTRCVTPVPQKKLQHQKRLLDTKMPQVQPQQQQWLPTPRRCNMLCCVPARTKEGTHQPALVEHPASEFNDAHHGEENTDDVTTSGTPLVDKRACAAATIDAAVGGIRSHGRDNDIHPGLALAGTFASREAGQASSGSAQRQQQPQLKLKSSHYKDLVTANRMLVQAASKFNGSPADATTAV